MRLDELPRSDNIEDRRGRGGGFPGGRSGAIIVLGIIGWLLGIDPRILIGGADGIQDGAFAATIGMVEASRDGSFPPA
jgi:uncharacterized protein